MNRRARRSGAQRRRCWASILGSLLLGALLAPAAGASTTPPTNLVVNGSFEQPVIPAGGWDCFATIAGWTRTAGSCVEVQSKNNLNTAADGDQYVELAGDNPTTISQSVPTIAGGAYTLAFAFRARPGTTLADNAVAVTVNGAPLATVKATDDTFYTTWYRYSYPIVATGQTTTIAFGDAGTPADSYGTFVDDVSMTDTTAPTLAPAVTPSPVVLNGTATATANAVDPDSGIAAQNCAPVDTSSVGAHTVTCTATNNAGLSASADAPYTVGYAICALYDQSKAHKLGSTVPIKLQLCDANGANVSAAGIVVNATGLAKQDATATATVDDAGAANSPDNNFRYDATLGATGGYIYNLSTKGLATGTWALSFTAGGATYTVTFDVQ